MTECSICGVEKETLYIDGRNRCKNCTQDLVDRLKETLRLVHNGVKGVDRIFQERCRVEE